MRTFIRYGCFLGILLTAVATAARADLLTFAANLNGAQEPTASTATGFGTVLLNTVADTITVDLFFNGLIGGGATAAHIHGPAPVGVNAGVIFPFMLGPAAGQTSGTMPEQVFSITIGQITELEAGLYYMNIHDAQFPAGEIRGQLNQVPEPASIPVVAALLGFGTVIIKRRRRA